MNKLQSVLFYIIMFFLSIFFMKKVEKCYINKDKIKNVSGKIIFFTTIAIGIPIIISAIRYKVGTDYNNYIDYYTVYSSLDFSNIIQNANELLFILVIKVAYLFKEPQIMFAIVAFLTVFITYRAILNKKEKMSIALMFALYIFLYYMYSLNIIRQMLAVSIIFYSYKYIINHNFKKFFLCVIIATLFHTTALLFLPFYFLFPKKENSNKQLVFLARIIVILMLLIMLLNYETTIGLITSINGFERFSLYEEISTQRVNKQIIINSLVLVVIILFQKPLKKYDKDCSTYIFLYLIGYILNLLGFISPYTKRIAYYFSISEIYLLSALPQITKNKEQKLVVTVLILIYAILMFVISTYTLNIGEIIPYQTFFNK